MGKYGSDDVAFLLIDGYDLKGLQTQFEDMIEALTEETDGLGDSWTEQTYVGLKRAQFSQQGFYDDAADGSNAALVSGPGVSRVLSYGVQGNTVGKKFTGYTGAMQVDYRRAASRGELHKANASYQGNGQVDEGVILHELSAETADGDTESESVDNGASSADGGAGYLHVTALDLDGGTDLTVKVRHSADDMTYADLLTFTAVTAAPDAERKAVSGTVNRYLASSWAFSGTPGSPSATFMVGFSRG